MGLMSRRYFWFYANFVFVLGIANLVSALNVYFKRNQAPTGPLLRTTIQLQGSVALCWIGFFTLANCFKSFILKCQQMKFLYKKLKVKLHFTAGMGYRWKFISVFGRTVTVLAAILPVIVTLIRVAAPEGKTDPICWTIYQFFSGIEDKVCGESKCGIFFRAALHFVQFVFAYLRAAEIVRLTFILFLIIVYFLEMQTTCLSIIKILSQRSRNGDPVHILYAALRLAHQESDFMYVIGAWMGIGFWVFLICNLYTLLQIKKGGGAWKYYVQFPIISAACLFYAVASIRAIADIYVESNSIIQIMKNKRKFSEHNQIKVIASSFYRRVMHKRWKSAQPVVYSCGPTFQLTKGIDLIFLLLLLLRTIDTLLIIQSR